MPRLRTIVDSDDAESETVRLLRLRREVQRQRRKNENSTEREDRRKQDTHARSALCCPMTIRITVRISHAVLITETVSITPEE
jgi:hypothetical protein